MLAKCANPYCAEVFHRLREGRLFVIDPEQSRRRLLPERRPEPQRRRPGLRYYWLCGECSQTMNLAWENGTVTLILKHHGKR